MRNELYMLHNKDESFWTSLVLLTPEAEPVPQGGLIRWVVRQVILGHSDHRLKHRVPLPIRNSRNNISSSTTHVFYFIL